MALTVAVDPIEARARVRLTFPELPLSLRWVDPADDFDPVCFGFGGWALPVQAVDTGPFVAFGTGRRITTTLRHRFDDRGRLVAITGPRGTEPRWMLDHDGDHLVRVRGPRRVDLRLTYHAGTVVLASRAGAVTAHLDADRRLHRIEGSSDGPCAIAMTGDRVSGVEHQGTTRLDRDAEGRVCTHATPTGLVTDVVRTAIPGGFASRLIHSTGRETRHTAETFTDGRRRTSRTCCGGITPTVTIHDGTTSTTKHADGTMETRGRPESPIWGELPDGMRTTTRTPGGVEAEIATWTEAGRTLMEIDGHRWTTERLDDDLVRTTSPLGRIAEVVTDDRGHTRLARMPGRPETRFVWRGDTLVGSEQGGWRRSVEVNGGVTTVHETGMAAVVISGDGDATRTVEQAGAVTRTTVGEGRLTITGPEGGTATITTSAAERVIEFAPIDGSSDPVTVRRAVDGLPVRLETPSGTVEAAWDSAAQCTRVQGLDIDRTHEHDDAGRRVSSAAAGTRTTTEWDGPLPVRETQQGADTYVVERRFDAFVPTSLDIDGLRWSISRDADGMVTTVGDCEIEHDAASGLVVGRRTGVVDERLERDEFGRISRQTVTAAGTLVFDRRTTFDVVGRRITVDEEQAGPSRRWAFRYDGRGRLVSVDLDGTTTTYTLDAESNRVETRTGDIVTSAAYDVRNRLRTRRTGDAETAWTWDRTDRLEAIAGPDGTTRFAFDSLGHLVAVDLPDGRRVTYTIDGLGRRVARAVDGTQTHSYAWDGQRLLAISNRSSRVVLVRGATRRPEYVLVDGRAHAAITDDVGSIRLLVDAETGAVTASQSFDVDGRVLDRSGMDLPLGLSGGLADPDTGLVLLGRRDLDPATGRWISRDPLLFGSRRTNLMAYTSDPVNRVDPTGTTDMPADLDGSHMGGGGGTYVPPDDGLKVDELEPGKTYVCTTDFMGVLDHYMVYNNGNVYGVDAPGGEYIHDVTLQEQNRKMRDDSFRCEEVPEVAPTCIDGQIQGRLGESQTFVAEMDFTPLEDFKPPSVRANWCLNEIDDILEACGGDLRHPGTNPVGGTLQGGAELFNEMIDDFRDFAFFW